MARLPGRARTVRGTLTVPADRGVRLVALELLSEAGRAADRLTGVQTRVGLHRFRVTLRRLRSWLRAFQGELGVQVGRQDRRRLREIASATNLGRDIDVQLAWLRRVAAESGGKRRRGALWMARQLGQRQRQAGGTLDATLLLAFWQVRDALVDRLFEEAPPRRRRQVATLGAALAATLEPHADTLVSALQRIRSPDDEAAAHKARIATKRLRYLVEPAASVHSAGPTILGQLKDLQDSLGTLHDAHLMAHQLRTTLSDVARRGTPAAASRVQWPPSLAADLRALGRRLDKEIDRAFRRAREEWRRGRLKKLKRDVSAFARALERIEPTA